MTRTQCIDRCSYFQSVQRITCVEKTEIVEQLIPYITTELVDLDSIRHAVEELGDSQWLKDDVLEYTLYLQNLNLLKDIHAFYEVNQ